MELIVPPRTLFVHVGTHCTGATEIQRFRRRSAGLLATYGLYVGINGTSDDLSGHHHIAWQLAQDKRHDAAHGTLAELILELSRVRYPCGIVSSEEFAFLVDQPGRIAEVEHAANAAGWQVVYILFLRQQMPYALSLFSEMKANHSIITPLHDFLHEIIDSGCFKINAKQIFHFDYARLIANWRAAATGELRVIDYGRACAGQGVVAALLGATGILGPGELLTDNAALVAAPGRARPSVPQEWLQASFAAREHFAKLNDSLRAEYGIELVAESLTGARRQASRA